VDGELDDAPEQAFYMRGSLDEVRAEAERMQTRER